MDEDVSGVLRVRIEQKYEVFDNTAGIFKYLIYALTQRFWTKVLVYTFK